MAGHWGFMFPEIVPAFGLLVTSPSWLVRLLSDNALGAAGTLAGGVATAVALLVLACRRRSHAIVHLAVLVLVGTGALTFRLA